MALLAVLLAALAALTACGSTQSSSGSTTLPATVEHVPGSDHPRIHLTSRAADRLGIQVAPVTDAQVPLRPGAATPVAASSPTPPAAASAPPPAAAATPVAGPEGDTTKPASPATPATPAAPAAPPAKAPPTTLRRVIPFEAVLYQPDGGAFSYTNPQPLVYVRLPLTIDYVVGDLAVLNNGPPPGTPVVTVGGTELLGIESGVGVGL